MRLTLGWSLALAVTAMLCLWLRHLTRAGAEETSPWARALGRLGESRPTMVALYFLVAVAVVAALAPLLAPHPPYLQPDPSRLRALAPSLAYPLGTDLYSRDVLSRVIYGTRVSVPIALLAVTLSVTLGTAYGAIAGYAGGRTDAVMMRMIDAALAIPRVLLLIAVLALWGGLTLPLLIVVLGLTGWFHVSRLVRAEVLAVREQDVVVAARALGASDPRVIGRHILPSVISPVIVTATLGVGHVIVLEAGLSFLGIGVQQPAASWGNMIAEAGGDIRALWWLSLFPGVAIVLTVMAFNILGDGLRDALDPRQVVGS